MAGKCCSISESSLISISDMRHALFLLVLWMCASPLSAQTLWPTLSYDDASVAPASAGVPFLASAAVPGLGQAMNRDWVKSTVFAAVEIGAIVFILDQTARAKTGRTRAYRYGDTNWSVVRYAGWLHGYYHDGGRSSGAPDLPITSLLTPAGLAVYNSTGQFPSPNFNNDADWALIDIEALRTMERMTIYRTTGREFSHTLPDYGSQQYYELMSKYPQFGPGWRDWDDLQNDINAGVPGMPFMFDKHGGLNAYFNDRYRAADNILMMLIANHVVSAFDAYFTVKLRNVKIEPGAMLTQDGGQLSVRMSF